MRQIIFTHQRGRIVHSLGTNEGFIQDYKGTACQSIKGGSFLTKGGGLTLSWGGGETTFAVGIYVPGYSLRKTIEQGVNSVVAKVSGILSRLPKENQGDNRRKKRSGFSVDSSKKTTRLVEKGGSL